MLYVVRSLNGYTQEVRFNWIEGKERTEEYVNNKEYQKDGYQFLLDVMRVKNFEVDSTKMDLQEFLENNYAVGEAIKITDYDKIDVEGFKFKNEIFRID